MYMPVLSIWNHFRNTINIIIPVAEFFLCFRGQASFQQNLSATSGGSTTMKELSVFKQEFVNANNIMVLVNAKNII